MRNLDRNKVYLYYATYATKTAITDASENVTGEYAISYNTPIKIKASVVDAGGEANIKLFGTELNYDKTITLERQFAGDIDENTVFVIDSPTLEYDDLGNLIYDYIVTRRIITLNTIVIAVTKVR